MMTCFYRNSRAKKGQPKGLFPHLLQTVDPLLHKLQLQLEVLAVDLERLNFDVFL
jgi:hypothetical protein